MILISYALNDALWINDLEDNKLTNIKMKGLCSGTYHIWYVYYSNLGKSIKNIKMIYISRPSC